MRYTKCIGCGDSFEIEKSKDITRYFNTEETGILAGAEDNGKMTEGNYLCESCIEQLYEDI